MTTNSELENAVKIIAEFMGFNWNERTYDGSNTLVKYENGVPKGFSVSTPMSLNILNSVWNKYFIFTKDWPKKTRKIAIWGTVSGWITSELYENPLLEIDDGP